MSTDRKNTESKQCTTPSVRKRYQVTDIQLADWESVSIGDTETNRVVCNFLTENGFDEAVRMANKIAEVMSKETDNNGLGSAKFKNGDKVKYSHGLTFVFVGLDPFDNTKAYCLHPTAICQDQPNLKYKRVDKLPLDRLTHCT